MVFKGKWKWPSVVPPNCRKEICWNTDEGEKCVIVFVEIKKQVL